MSTRMTQSDFAAEVAELQGLVADTPTPGRIIISSALMEAIAEIAAAVAAPVPDWRLIAALTGVKSYIGGPPAKCPNTRHFWDDTPEDYEGESPYGILDALHFEAAQIVGVLPSGLSTFTATGAKHGRVDTGAGTGSPTLQRIAEEEAAYHV